MRMRPILFITSLLLASAASAGGFVVHVSGHKCVPGLYQQPSVGHYAVSVACDSELGTRIGVVDTASPAGAGKPTTPAPKAGQTSGVNGSLWRDAHWATDVTSFTWSPDLKYLYVATSSTYGDGGLYKLNLDKHDYTQLLPHREAPASGVASYTAVITGIDERTGVVSVRANFLDDARHEAQTVRLKIK